MTRAWLIGAVVAAIVALPAEAVADRVTVGLYAPSAPFGGPSDRLQYVTRLAGHLSHGDVEVVGRVFARAGDFQAAVSRGAVQLAVVDAPYAAAQGRPMKVLAVTTRGGQPSSAWHMVAPIDVRGLADVAGKTVAMPRTGHRELDFLCNVLLEGQVDASYFGSVTRTPDSFSAVTMVKLGRAAAAFVPGGVTLPPGMRVVLTLRELSWPLVVALPGADPGVTRALAARAGGFGDGPLSGTTDAVGDLYRDLRAAYTRPRRTTLMAAGRPGRAGFDGLVAGRRFAIVPPSVWELFE